MKTNNTKLSIQFEDIQGSSVNYCSWERLKPYLIQAAGGPKPNEVISGVEADEEGLKIRFIHKDFLK